MLKKCQNSIVFAIPNKIIDIGDDYQQQEAEILYKGWGGLAQLIVTAQQ